MKDILKKGLGVIMGVGVFALGLKMYAFSQWPQLSEVAPLKYPTSDIKADLAALDYLEDILSKTPSDLQAPTIMRENYKTEDTSYWRVGMKALSALEKMKDFSQLYIHSTEPSRNAIEGSHKLYTLLELNEIKTWDLIKQGKTDDALHQISLTLHLSHLILEANVSSAEMLFPIIRQRMILAPLQEILDTDGWGSTEIYQSVLSMLLAVDDDSSAMINGYRYDARFADHYLQNIDGIYFLGKKQDLLFWELNYDQAATRAAVNLYYHDVIALSGKPFLERPVEPQLGVSLDPVASYLHNHYGYYLLDMLTSPMINMIELEEEELLIAQRRVLISLCAARLYMWENDGRLPTSMTDLIPQYLSSIPKDPFGSGSIALENGAIFSVVNNMDVIDPEEASAGFLQTIAAGLSDRSASGL